MLASRLRLDLDLALSDRGSFSDDGPLFVRASGLGDCARKLTYAMQSGEAESADPYGMLMAVQGNWIEEGLRDFIRKMPGWQVEHDQLELDYEKDGHLILRGHIDGLIREDTGIIDSPWALWECKGMSAFRFRKLNQKGLKDGEPGYYDQLQAYMTLLNYTTDYEVPGALFIAIAKDPSSLNQPRNGSRLDPIFVLDVEWDEAHGQRLLDRAETIWKLGVDGELAPRERNPNKDWDCSARFCRFFYQCDPKAALLRRAA